VIVIGVAYNIKISWPVFGICSFFKFVIKKTKMWATFLSNVLLRIK
jgi:hypothetical protein